jgi:hypothetical protein
VIEPGSRCSAIQSAFASLWLLTMRGLARGFKSPGEGRGAMCLTYEVMGPLASRESIINNFDPSGGAS